MKGVIYERHFFDGGFDKEHWERKLVIEWDGPGVFFIFSSCEIRDFSTMVIRICSGMKHTIQVAKIVI